MTEPLPTPLDATPEETPRRGVLRRALLYLLALGITAFAATLAGSLLLLPFDGQSVRLPVLYLALELPLAAAVFGLTLLFWQQFDQLPSAQWGLHRPTRRDLALAVAVALPPTLGGLGIDLASGHARIAGVAPGGPIVLVGNLLLFAALGLAVGLAEETPFRGYLLPNLARRIGVCPAILLTSMLFAGMHLVDPAHWKPLNLLELTLAGVGFALLRLGTGSLTLPILAHACYDFALFVSGADRDFRGVLRTEIGPYNLWLGGEEQSGLIGILILAAWVAVLWRWVYLPGKQAGRTPITASEVIVSPPVAS